MTTDKKKPDSAAQWESALRVYPLYLQLSREFVLDVEPCPDLESGLEAPDQEAVGAALKWLHTMDEKIQTHQLRQFLQTNATVDQASVLSLLKHLLDNGVRSESCRDKVDFMLVQYFNLALQGPIGDNEVNLERVADALEPVVGGVELKLPVWLNALDRVLEAARKCKTLDELLHGGVLVQGRKIKTQARELFYLPVALVAFTRFGFLMRRCFFHLMHNDLNCILEGLDELQTQGIGTLDCRRAQFSAQEPVDRLRMVCQSWKVMFQAEYSSGQPLRLLVDLKASVDQALGRTPAASPETKKPAAAAGPAAAKATGSPSAKQSAAKPAGAAPAKAAAAKSPAAKSDAAAAKPKAKAAAADMAEFEVSSGVPGWGEDSESTKKK